MLQAGCMGCLKGCSNIALVTLASRALKMRYQNSTIRRRVSGASEHVASISWKTRYHVSYLPTMEAMIQVY